MAVYTDVSDDDLGVFLAAYDLGEVLSFKGIAEGVENSNFLLETARGRFILTLYEKRVERADLPFFIGLMEHLAGRGVSCPLPVHARSGEVLGALAGKPAAIFTFLQGLSVRRPKVAQCGLIGSALAGLHLAARDFPMRRENALSVAGWLRLFDAFADRADQLSAGFSAELAAECAFAKARWPADLPRGVIHADLFPDNVFFRDARVSGIIDFYFACQDALAYDLAICLNAWCFEPDASFNVTKGQALISGYHAVRALERAEIDALPILARGAALRFLLTRSYDWLHTPANALVRPKDPNEYRRKLKFHQSARSAADYGFSR
ncbi:MAG: homoserine kinase [Hyphomicrobiales bacterium]|nr:homoserine kinase [Hyphomicrobiales bacterium]